MNYTWKSQNYVDVVVVFWVVNEIIVVQFSAYRIVFDVLYVYIVKLLI